MNAKGADSVLSAPAFERPAMAKADELVFVSVLFEAREVTDSRAANNTTMSLEQKTAEVCAACPAEALLRPYSRLGSSCTRTRTLRRFPAQTRLLRT